MNTQLTLDAFGLEELDGATMMAVNGGLGGWVDVGLKTAAALFACIVSSSDSLIDGVKEGWAAAS